MKKTLVFVFSLLLLVEVLNVTAPAAHAKICNGPRGTYWVEEDANCPSYGGGTGSINIDGPIAAEVDDVYQTRVEAKDYAFSVLGNTWKKLLLPVKLVELQAKIIKLQLDIAADPDLAITLASQSADLTPKTAVFVAACITAEPFTITVPRNIKNKIKSTSSSLSHLLIDEIRKTAADIWHQNHSPGGTSTSTPPNTTSTSPVTTNVVGTVSFSSTENVSGDTYSFSVTGGPASTSGDLYKQIGTGDPKITLRWLKTNASGNATKGPWTCAKGLDDPAVTVYIKWPDGTTTNTAVHHCDYSNLSAPTSPTSTLPDTGVYGNITFAADIVDSSGNFVRNLTSSEASQVSFIVERTTGLSGFGNEPVAAIPSPAHLGTYQNVPASSGTYYAKYLINNVVAPSGYSLASTATDPAGALNSLPANVTTTVVFHFVAGTGGGPSGPSGGGNPPPVGPVGTSTVAAEDPSAGSLQFVKNIIDTTSKGTNYELIAARTVSLYGKTFLVVGYGQRQVSLKELFVFDVSSPLSPVLLKENDVSAAGASPGLGQIAVLNNYNYLIVANGAFNISSDGSASFINFGNPVNLISGLFRKPGNSQKVYGYAPGGTAQGLVIYDVTDPTAISQVGSYEAGFATGSGCVYYGAEGLTFPPATTWNTVTISGKAYLIAEGNVCVNRLHVAEDSVLYVFDVTNPENPTLAHRYEMADSFRHLLGASQADKTYMFPGFANIFVDPGAQRVYDFYRITDDYSMYVAHRQNASSTGTASVLDYQNGAVVLSANSDASLTEIFRSLLCSQTGYLTIATPRYCGELSLYREAIGAPLGNLEFIGNDPQEGLNGIFIFRVAQRQNEAAPGSGALGLFTGNNLVSIPDPSGEMLKFFNSLANSSWIVRGGDLSGTAKSVTGGVVLQVDSKTYAVYQIHPWSMDLVKVSLTQSRSIVSGGETGVTTATQSYSTSSNAFPANSATPFSFNSLLNIFKRILQQ